MNLNTNPIMCASAKVYKSTEIIKSTEMPNPLIEMDKPVVKSGVKSVVKKRKFVIHEPTIPTTVSTETDATIGITPESAVNNIKETLIDMIQQETLKTLHTNHTMVDSDETHILAHLGDYIEEPYTLIESYFQGHIWKDWSVIKSNHIIISSTIKFNARFKCLIPSKSIPKMILCRNETNISWR